MTTAPIPPTDNLYKFSAIVGTLILILAFYYPYLYNTIIREKQDATTLLLDKNLVNLKYLQGKLDNILEIQKNSIAEQQGKIKIDSKKLNIYYSQEEYKQLINEAFTLRKECALNSAESDLYVKQSNYLFVIGIVVAILGIIFIVIGFYLAIWGYENWYYKVQIYQDKEIENRVGKIEIEIPVKKKSKCFLHFKRVSKKSQYN